jgi:hypothetical protein
MCCARSSREAMPSALKAASRVSAEISETFDQARALLTLLAVSDDEIP